MTDNFKIEQLTKSLEPFAKAFERLIYLGQIKRNDIRLFAIDHEGDLCYELLDIIDGKSLTIQHLAGAYETLSILRTIE